MLLCTRIIWSIPLSVDNLDLQGRLVVESIRRKSECTEEAAEEEEEEHQQQQQQQQQPQSQLEEEEEEEEETAATGKEGRATNGETLGPPPPPLPPPPMGPLSNGGNNNNSSGAAAAAATDRQQQQQLRQQQPLATISIQDLTSVQLRRTNNKMHAAKTFSAPPNRSVSMTNVSESFFVQKTDLIAELKKTKDILGIKKMKVQRAQVEKSQEQNMMSEISKTFSIANFVDQIPEKDSSGNVIPIWKRQMLARKAAERAKKELEEQIARENEEKRQKAIPPWKRQLLAKKESCGGDAKTSTPAVLEIPPPPPIEDSNGNNNGLSNGKAEETTTTTTTTCNNNNNNNNNHKRPNNDEDDDTETVHIIPWRAQLRKTNSKLNILD
ncbi:unnamed protein product [Trichogramma brassicae]|uniref:Uncharacterized protein n=1 Tax=Trichogramma brassicae TaxID=86971 RepID=A0A6H5IAI5_9HYME|nr:unnamed protein product [Trichogramma brassicae]